jgi:hypothetical protein
MFLPVLADIVSELLRAFGDAISTLFAFIPALLGALIILLIGWIIGRLVAAIARRVLRALHFDRAMERARVDAYLQRGGVRADAVDVLASLVFWFIFLIFVLAAAEALRVPAISNIVNAIVLWLPQLFVALIVLIIGVLLARLVSDVVRAAMDGAGISGGPVLAGIAGVAVVAFAAIIALNQIGVGAAVVQELFGGVIFGLALALALAFGLGGRDTAKNIVDSWYDATRRQRATRAARSQDTRQTGASRASEDAEGHPPLPA